MSEAMDWETQDFDEAKEELQHWCNVNDGSYSETDSWGGTGKEGAKCSIGRDSIQIYDVGMRDEDDWSVQLSTDEHGRGLEVEEATAFADAIHGTDPVNVQTLTFTKGERPVMHMYARD